METGVLEQLSLSRDELFVHKLVDATLMKNRLWAHLSNECEDGREHAVYVADYESQKPVEYGAAIADAALAMCRVSSTYGAEYMRWDGRAFQEFDPGTNVSYTMELAEALLDHYLVRQGITYEIVYSVLDTDRRKVVIFVKEVDL